MSLKKKVIESADFYNRSFLKFDYQLADFNFLTLKPFFRGKRALELGPASGYMTKSLVKEFDSIDLVEGSESLIGQIPDYPNVRKFRAYFGGFFISKISWDVGTRTPILRTKT